MSKLTQEEADLEASLSSAPTEVAEFAEQDGGLIRKAQHVLHQNPALVPLIVLIVSVIIFGAILGSKFFSPFALTLILQQVQIVAILGAAQSLVILTAGIDLSVGAIMVLSSVVMGQFTFRYGIPVELGIIFRRVLLPPLKSFFDGPSTVNCVAVAACTVVISPSSIPKLSFNTLAIGAKQLVVHDALDTIRSTGLTSR